MEYRAPASIEEVISDLRSTVRPSVLAGGTDLIVQMHTGRRLPDAVIDIKGIASVMTIRKDPAEIRIGAAAPFSDIAQSGVFSDIFPGMVDAATLVGSVQIQHRASLGGNVCNASPAADSVPVLLVNSARCEVHSASGGRELPVSEFILGPGRSVLGAHDFLTSIVIPMPPAVSADAYGRIIPRTEMDIAIAGAAVRLSLDRQGTCDLARVAIGAVGPKAILVPEAAASLRGTQLDDAALDGLEQAVRDAASPISDVRGTAEYRRHVIGVLARRVARTAYNRAKDRLAARDSH